MTTVEPGAVPANPEVAGAGACVASGAGCCIGSIAAMGSFDGIGADAGAWSVGAGLSGRDTAGA